MIRRAYAHDDTLVIDRFETGLVNAGVPDTNWGWDGQERWVELKAIKTGYQVAISQHQLDWHKARRAVKISTWLLIYHLPSENILLYPSEDAERLKELGIREVPPCSTYQREARRRYDWEKLKRDIFA